MHKAHTLYNLTWHTQANTHVLIEFVCNTNVWNMDSSGRLPDGAGEEERDEAGEGEAATEGAEEEELLVDTEREEGFLPLAEE